MSEKTFEPTPEKLRKALTEGKTKRSQVLASAFLSLLVVLGLRQLLRFNWVRIEFLVDCLWSNPLNIYGECGGEVISGAYIYVFAIACLVLVVTIALTWAQVGSIWLPCAVLPDLKRVSLSQGAGKISSGLGSIPQLIGRGSSALIIIAILFWGKLGVIMQLPDSYLEQQWRLASQLLGAFSVSATAVLVGFGLFDIKTQRKKFREQVYLDINEMKRESRESDGDPHLRAHRRALHQAISREEMITQIKKAKVIIVERFEQGAQEADRGEG